MTTITDDQRLVVLAGGRPPSGQRDPTDTHHFVVYEKDLKWVHKPGTRAAPCAVRSWQDALVGSSNQYRFERTWVLQPDPTCMALKPETTQTQIVAMINILHNKTDAEKAATMQDLVDKLMKRNKEEREGTGN
eukprot:TRINITY_DN67821_c5_g7_i9.p3 TRINITY_DN67821_c5_g7~~TRINITY_DN67821_c5_g7_i9.p3  ORF type:complete len:133 (-),score=18.20 TRINITY_DN67821_c5_g7_i9:1091-1489(-)